MKFCTHAHIFNANESFEPNPRYVPNYTASCEQYLSNLDANGFDGGVLIQPSFLGTNNSLMLEALKTHSNLRASVVCEPGEMADFCEQVVGIRFNLIGDKNADFSQFAADFAQMKKQNRHIQLHANCEKVLEIIENLVEFDTQIIIDHLARPLGSSGKTHAAASSFNPQILRQNLENFKRFRGKKIAFKVSGIYRCGEVKIIKEVYEFLRDIFGASNFVFGSDWPHTNFENSIDFQTTLEQFYAVVERKSEQEQILGENAQKFFRF